MTSFTESLKYLKRDKIQIHGPTGFGSEVQKISDDEKLGIRLAEPEFSRVALHTPAGQRAAKQVLLNQFNAGAAYILTPTWVRDSAGKGLSPTWRRESHALNEIGIKIALEVKAHARAHGIDLPLGGDLGPVLDSHNPTAANLREYNADQIFDLQYRKALQLAPNVNWLHFETISTGLEGQIAVDVAKQIFKETGGRVHSILSFTPAENGDLRDGAPLSDVTKRAANTPAIDAWGVNCVPIDWVQKPLEELHRTGKPVIAAPNGPGEHEVNTNGDLNWRLVHEATVARQFAQKLLELDATLKSACCGTTSSPHGTAINEVFKAQHERQGVRTHYNVAPARRFAFA